MCASTINEYKKATMHLVDYEKVIEDMAEEIHRHLTEYFRNRIQGLDNMSDDMQTFNKKPRTYKKEDPWVGPE